MHQYYKPASGIRCFFLLVNNLLSATNDCILSLIGVSMRALICSVLIVVLFHLPTIAFAGVDDGHAMFILICVEVVVIIASLVLAGIITTKNLFGFDNKHSVPKLITNILVFVVSFVVIALLLINISGAIVDMIP
ncbi:MAG: hypothetical protein A2X58_01725 [Nitrospirae bacterium GWC2_56_14]|nr:MAG: hypothetical protein A2X58_01725 [Nitrospirae bacterium GWC2_56_14]